MADFIMENTYGHYDYEICFYVIPSFLAYLFFVLFLVYQEADLYSTLNTIYSMYITVTTVFLSVIFVVIAMTAAFFENEPDQKAKAARKSEKNHNFPIFSKELFGINRSVLYFCIPGLVLSLMAYIFTASHLFPVYLLKLLFLISTFFVLGSVFGLVLFTDKILKNIKSYYT
jgi:hypothetical protein